MLDEQAASKPAQERMQTVLVLGDTFFAHSSHKGTAGWSRCAAATAGHVRKMSFSTAA